MDYASLSKEELIKEIASLAAKINSFDKIKLNEELIKSEERFRKLSETAFEAIIIHEEGIVSEVNSAFCKMFGYTSEEIIGKHVMSFNAEESHKKILEQLKTKLERPFEAVSLRKDGTKFLCEVKAHTIPYKGKTARVVAVIDISKHKAYEEQLLASEKKYREFFNHTPAGIIVYIGTEIVFANPNAFQLLKLPEKLLEGGKTVSIFEFVEKEYHEKIKKRTQLLLEGKDFPSPPFKVKRGDGKIIDIETKSSIITFEGKKAVQTIFYDVSERVQTELSLKENEARFRTLAENALDVVYRYSLVPSPH